MKKTYHSTSISISADNTMSDGLATEYDDGSVGGHVSIYTSDGSVAIRSEDPAVLDALADALRNASSLLYTAQAERVIESAIDAAAGGL